jgi:glycosyltransferase involved in cell wall biosynthesis
VPHADVPALLGQVDVFVLPSLLEGFGLVLLEALAAGVPFISTPNTGASDLPGDPTLGRLVPAGSAEALLAAFEHALAHPPDRAAVRAAVRPLESSFSWEAYGDRWANLLRTTA